jgi:NADH-quinone oxidoreductase subunit L
MILATIMLPAITGSLLWAFGMRVPAPRRPLWLGSVAVAALVLAATSAAGAASTGAATSMEWAGALALQLSAAGLAGVAAVLVPAVASCVVAAASRSEAPVLLPRLLGLLVSFVGAMQLLVLADDLLTLAIAWELVAAASWALIGSEWHRSDTVRHAGHAFITMRASSVGLLVASGMTFAATGSVGYAALAELPQPALDVAAAGVVVAALAKSAQLPFSPWLFSAMAGPTPVSALLHSATMVAAGVYALIRVERHLSAVPWFMPVLTTAGLTTALVGGVIAISEVHGKRILAASTAAQYGLMVAAVGVGAPGAAGAHLIAHALFKSQLFLAVGVGIHATGTADVRRWGLGRQMPAVATSAVVGALALGAVPPLGGAWTKEQITAAAVEAGPAVGALAVLAGTLSTVYAVRLLLLAYGRRPDRGTTALDAPARTEVRAIGTLAATSVALSFLWLPGGRRVAEHLVARPIESGHAWELLLAVALVAVGVGLAAILVHRNWVAPPRLAAAAGGWFGLPTLSRRGVADPVLALATGLARFDDAVVDAAPRAAAHLVGRLSSALPRLDDVMVDGAVRGVVRLAGSLSRLAAHVVELGVDGAVAALATATERVGRMSQIGDDRAVDGAVERLAGAVGGAGTNARRLQTGLAHHYYVIAVVGLIVLLITAAVWR